MQYRAVSRLLMALRNVAATQDSLSGNGGRGRTYGRLDTVAFEPSRTLRNKPFHRDFSQKFGMHCSSRSPIRMSGCTRYWGEIAHVSISQIWTQSKRTSLARKVDGIANCPAVGFQ
jgi:hypothetical protein